MVKVEFISLNDRREKSDVIKRVAEAVYGSPEKSAYSEQFIPIRGQVPEPKVVNFTKFLINIPKCLWVVYFNDLIVGFILIIDMPHPNSIGFGIDVDFSSKGITYDAWLLVKSDVCIKFPLFASTSKRNIGANKLLKKIGFEDLCEDFDFFGETSSRFILKG